jgi:hypothetical protein
LGNVSRVSLKSVVIAFSGPVTERKIGLHREGFEPGGRGVLLPDTFAFWHDEGEAER